MGYVWLARQSGEAYPSLTGGALDDFQYGLTSLLQETLSHPSLQPTNRSILPRKRAWLAHLDPPAHRPCSMPSSVLTPSRTSHRKASPLRMALTALPTSTSTPSPLFQRTPRTHPTRLTPCPRSWNGTSAWNSARACALRRRD